jgi:(p)ppGpp synthase/HD superfamily hydrolase
MIYTHNIQKAIRFSIDVHELNRPERQLRKGKDIAYITHPLTVGLILAKAGVREEVIVAGILHDTIEDSHENHKVTVSDVEANFGPEVAELVASVSETDKSLTWAERKAEALEHIKHFSHESLLLKSGDIISNVSEIIQDYAEVGETVFERFNASKDDILRNSIEAITAILTRWPETPLAGDLENILGALTIMRRNGDSEQLIKNL